jgi:hypothetical protein
MGEGVHATSAVAVRSAPVRSEDSFGAAWLRSHEGHSGSEAPLGGQVVVALIIVHPIRLRGATAAHVPSRLEPTRLDV